MGSLSSSCIAMSSSCITTLKEEYEDTFRANNQLVIDKRSLSSSPKQDESDLDIILTPPPIPSLKGSILRLQPCELRLNLFQDFSQQSNLLNAEDFFESLPFENPPKEDISVYEAADESVYMGECNTQGKPHGRGVLKKLDNSLHKGLFNNGQSEGVGRVLYSDGSMFQGVFVNGKAKGLGVFVSKTKDKSKGLFSGNKLNGFGKQWLHDGSVFEGQFRDNLKCGIGRIELPTVGNYVGEFRNDEIHGEGEFIWYCGDKYKGMWRKGKMNGDGTFEWASGETYTGRFCDNEIA